MNGVYVNTSVLQTTELPPVKNTTFPIVAYCVSYNYMDTLQFMLPINYLHFDHIYLVTQKNDLPTIAFCKQFTNVTVLFWNFKTNGFRFDKFGAINYALKEMYKEYPNHWYLGIDSDILLPTNFIRILEQEQLQEACLYGGMRHNAEKLSQLGDIKKVLKTGYKFNNIVLLKNLPPSILGCFQMHKKQTFNKVTAIQGKGDFEFGYQNFNLFCHLPNLHYIHIGPSGKNWFGKVKEFIIDTNKITKENLYYFVNDTCTSVYYNKKREVMTKQSNGQFIPAAVTTTTAKTTTAKTTTATKTGAAVKPGIARKYPKPTARTSVAKAMATTIHSTVRPTLLTSMLYNKK